MNAALDTEYVLTRNAPIEAINREIAVLEQKRAAVLADLLEDLEFMDVPTFRVPLTMKATINVGDTVHYLRQEHEDPDWPVSPTEWVHNASRCDHAWCDPRRIGQFRAGVGQGKRGYRYVHAFLGDHIVLAKDADCLILVAKADRSAVAA